MKSFRSLKERLESCSELNKDGLWEVVDQDGVDEVLNDEEAMKWVRAQRGAAKLRNLSESRCKYLDHLPGLDWTPSLICTCACAFEKAYIIHFGSKSLNLV